MNFHIKKLDRIRASANSRIECLCKNYTYLRDCYSDEWRSSKLDHKRLISMTQQISTLNSLPTGAGWCCPSCKTSFIHTKDTPCPLAHLSNKQAAKAVANLFAGKLVLPPQE